jgi:hypothetical protein
MKPRTTLVTRGVYDVERTVAFYRDGLGAPGPLATFLDCS